MFFPLEMFVLHKLIVNLLGRNKINANITGIKISAWIICVFFLQLSKPNVCQVPTSLFCRFHFKSSQSFNEFSSGSWFYINNINKKLFYWLVATGHTSMRRFFNGNVSNLISRVLKKVAASALWDLANLWLENRKKKQPNYYWWRLLTVLLVLYLMSLRYPREWTISNDYVRGKGRKTTCTCTELIEYKSQ